MKKLLKLLGLIKISEYAALEEQHKKLSEIFNKNISTLNECKKEVEDMPYDFDNLLKRYSEKQLNALVYKIINDTRNNPETAHYLVRWQERITNAIENPYVEPDSNIKS